MEKRTLRQGDETPRRFYGVAEMAGILGMSEMTLYRAIHAREFPALRVRGRLIIPAEAIELMVEAAMARNAVVDAAEWTAGRIA